MGTAFQLLDLIKIFKMAAELCKGGEDRPTTKKMLNMQVQGKRRMGRPKKRWLDNIREDMKEYKMTEDMTQNRSVWHVKIKAGPLLHGGGL